MESLWLTFTMITYTTVAPERSRTPSSGRNAPSGIHGSPLRVILKLRGERDRQGAAELVSNPSTSNAAAGVTENAAPVEVSASAHKVVGVEAAGFGLQADTDGKAAWKRSSEEGRNRSRNAFRRGKEQVNRIARWLLDSCRIPYSGFPPFLSTTVAGNPYRACGSCRRCTPHPSLERVQSCSSCSTRSARAPQAVRGRGRYRRATGRPRPIPVHVPEVPCGHYPPGRARGDHHDHNPLGDCRHGDQRHEQRCGRDGLNSHDRCRPMPTGALTLFSQLRPLPVRGGSHVQAQNSHANLGRGRSAIHHSRVFAVKIATHERLEENSLGTVRIRWRGIPIRRWRGRSSKGNRPITTTYFWPGVFLVFAVVFFCRRPEVRWRFWPAECLTGR